MRYQGFGYKIFIGDISAFIVDPAREGRRDYVSGVMLALWGLPIPNNANDEVNSGYSAGSRMFNYGGGKKAKGEQMAYNTRRQFRRKEREAASLVLMQKGPKVCAHCGSDKNIHIDHIIPVTKGGTNDMSNLQFLCRSCNSMKGNK